MIHLLVEIYCRLKNNESQFFVSILKFPTYHYLLLKFSIKSFKNLTHLEEPGSQCLSLKPVRKETTYKKRNKPGDFMYSLVLWGEKVVISGAWRGVSEVTISINLWPKSVLTLSRRESVALRAPSGLKINKIKIRKFEVYFVSKFESLKNLPSEGKAVAKICNLIFQEDPQPLLDFLEFFLLLMRNRTHPIRPEYHGSLMST